MPADRQELDSAFNDRMKQVENYGTTFSPSADKVNRTVNGRDYREKTHRLQKDMQTIIDIKLRDNRARGRQYGQGDY